MPEPTTGAQASVEASPQAEIAEIEKAVAAQAGEGEPTSENQEPSAFDKLAAKKGFKSVEDLVASYENLEKTLAPQASELKELRRMVGEINQQIKPKEKDILDDLPEDQRGAVSLLEQVLERKIKTLMAPVLEKVEVEKASKRIQDVKEAFPGTDTADIDKAISIMEKYRDMTLEDAVRIATYEKAKQGAANVSRKTATNQQNKRAFAESASSARNADETDYSKMTFEELEQIIPR
jgi:hypothetical protein